MLAPIHANTMGLLEIKDVSKSFGELQALNNVSFELKKGEVFGLAGPNGSGKTTLFNVITGIERGSGKIKLEGENINGLRPQQICHKGIVRTFQTPMVFSTLTIFENLEVGVYFGEKERNNQKQRIHEIINFVGLEGKEGVMAGALPLFDRKLTMLASALGTEPKILLLDEPLAGLSPKEIEKSLNLFRRMNEELNLTIIVIDHLMRELVGICERLMIIHYGVLISIGTPEEVTKDNRVIEVYLGKRYARNR